MAAEDRITVRRFVEVKTNEQWELYLAAPRWTRHRISQFVFIELSTQRGLMQTLMHKASINIHCFGFILATGRVIFVIVW